MNDEAKRPAATSLHASASDKQIVLPWHLAISICWLNVKNRMGRLALVLVGISVVVAFLMSSLTYRAVVADLMKQNDVHVRAVLEQAGMFINDADALKKHEDQQTWLMTLSGILCLVGIANTMLMSVTERIREIGTLKCLGALDRFVVRLFMLESVFVGLIGSLVGAVLGYAFTILQVGLGLEFAMLTGPVLIQALVGIPVAILAGTVFTVLAAVYPTYVAARMKPVDAMRVEV